MTAPLATDISGNRTRVQASAMALPIADVHPL
jgi:hypothetical protein